MPNDKERTSTKTCFVVMGFGKKTDFETGRVLDLDKSYKNMIKPAVEAAGLKCIRADEIVHSGLIDVPMYEQLLKADVVVADLSTSNKNAFYELGIRHALRPFTTVIIAEDGIKTFPFDVNHVAIRQYHHLGEDIGFEEVMRFRKLLTDSITEILKKDPQDKDSPVYSLLHNLTPPAIAAAVQAAIQDTGNKGKVDFDESFDKDKENDLEKKADPTHSFLMQQVDEAQKKGDWRGAKTLLSLVRQMIKDEIKKQQELAQKELVEQPEDAYLLQRLALITYKAKSPNEHKALLEAQELLVQLNPSTSNDPETLGLWGAVHKRLWETTKDHKWLDEAIRGYERGFYIKNDYYNGINFAFLLNLRAAQEDDHAEAITDFVEAKRIRKEVLSICEKWLIENPAPSDKVPESAINGYLKSWYWVKATMGEAFVGLGNEVEAQKALNEAFAKAPEEWMRQSTEEQLGKLRPLFENSPLKFIMSED
jgi:tetratricopeptide (TPR) repeat protein